MAQSDLVHSWKLGQMAQPASVVNAWEPLQQQAAPVGVPKAWVLQASVSHCSPVKALVVNMKQAQNACKGPHGRRQQAQAEAKRHQSDQMKRDRLVLRKWAWLLAVVEQAASEKRPEDK